MIVRLSISDSYFIVKLFFSWYSGAVQLTNNNGVPIA